MFEWSDMFAAGSGCDIAGAFLLARGLIVGSNDILRRSITGERFFAPAETASQIRDKVDATLGLTILVCGFIVQAGAYAVLAGGVSSGEGSAAGAGVAVAIALLALVICLSIATRARWPLTRRVIVAIASDRLQLGSDYEFRDAAEPRLPPSLARLVPLGAEFGHRPEGGESDVDFAKRTFKVSEVSAEPDFLATAYRPARLA